jgi:hypothetical protein
VDSFTAVRADKRHVNSQKAGITLTWPSICILRNGMEWNRIHLGRGYFLRLVPFRSAKYRLGVEICILRNGTRVLIHCQTYIHVKRSHCYANSSPCIIAVIQLSQLFNSSWGRVHIRMHPNPNFLTPLIPQYAPSVCLKPTHPGTPYTQH